MYWMFQQTPELLPEDQTLPGGKHPVLENPRPHTVLGTPITGPWKEGQKSLIVGIGCFWGVEKIYWQMAGVESTSVGYAGGVTPNPTYREVCTGRTNHTEVVEVVYDPAKVSLDELVKVALENHDPTQVNRQGNDVGTQYRSAIFTTGPDAEADKRRVREIVDAYAKELAGRGFGEVTTEVKTLAETPSGRYYLAEDYHQQYLQKVPDGYCPHHSTGVACTIPAKA
ncbi:peptide-methionine (S)-S-oxide reductase MsrA [Corynebacterium guangdongense]|uniref:Peptide methionine sulfoxide reductase MsrA n=1 Tax=Corynebacterium guangdongense TaxID=1783348 RepID=A0ABU2A002_9CORY|nr:peptide-methionine (S)-S-oxide reductase MsrA [Corynebacterium guangdongense]MDR7330494.1 peptide-methionine (S)-S-oxide reductase [Corynebacterium guangdongense]WJZ19050.1 Peptide methionine sulfoxide reductase MsrA [Corynebacterium guangdongense]